MDHLRDNDAAAMKLQDEFNDRTRMEDGDTSLARELQMELEGTGEQGGYRNGSEWAYGAHGRGHGGRGSLKVGGH